MNRRKILGALLVFATVNLLLAFGRYGGLYPLLVELPGFRSIRAPARHLVLVHLALSGVGALVFEDLLALSRDRHRLTWMQLRPLAAIIGLSLVTTAVGTTLAGSSWAASQGLRLSGLGRAAPWALVVMMMVFLVMLAARGLPGALPAAIVLSALDLGLWGYTYVFRWGPIQPIAELQATATAPADATRGDLIPIFPGGRDGYSVLRDLRLTAGYTGLYARRILDPGDPAVQRVAGVAWIGDGERSQRVTDSMPRARLVAESLVSGNAAKDLEHIDPSRTALVDRLLALSGSPGAARLIADRPGRMTIETEADGTQILVVTERFHRGWTALIDGREFPTLPVYGDFLGCVIPAGRHHVELTFRPFSVRLGLLTTLAALAAAFGGSHWLRRERRAS